MGSCQTVVPLKARHPIYEGHRNETTHVSSGCIFGLKGFVWILGRSLSCWTHSSRANGGSRKGSPKLVSRIAHGAKIRNRDRY